MDGAAGVGDSGVGAGSDVGLGVSDVVAITGFVTGAFAVFLTEKMVTGLDSPDLGDFFLRVTSVQPSWSFVLGWT